MVRLADPRKPEIINSDAPEPKNAFEMNVFVDLGRPALQPVFSESEKRHRQPVRIWIFFPSLDFPSLLLGRSDNGSMKSVTHCLFIDAAHPPFADVPT
jgi:hypothetical protein